MWRFRRRSEGLRWRSFPEGRRKKHSPSSVKPETTAEISIDLGSGREPLVLSFGKLARFADGSCVARLGSTSVLSTAVSRTSQAAGPPSSGFLPLTVDYRQKAAAAGRIPTNFLRRELGTSDREILTSRVIDRSLRPLFPKGYGCDTQVVANLLAVDSEHQPDVLGLNAASAALATSDIPWDGPIGAVRVGYSESGDFLLNPTRSEVLRLSAAATNRKPPALNILVAGTADGKVVMLEAEAGIVDPSLFLDGIRFGVEYGCSRIARQVSEAARASGIVKRPWGLASTKEAVEDSQLFKDMELLCAQPLRSLYLSSRYDKVSSFKAATAIKDKAIAELANAGAQDLTARCHEVFNKVSRKVMADLVFEDGKRVDGRDAKEIRPIFCEVDLHGPLHGSALFQRGQTQVMCTVALDSLESALKSDMVSIITGGVKEKNFFLHYEFPPYATNEIGRPGSNFDRRELGHGALAEKALKAVVPKDFPFTIRLTSEVLESNGSSSMASVCGGSMALLDAGVPLAAPAAGVAVGLVSRQAAGEGDEAEFQVLLDILGMEDMLGEMDFKVAGTREGVTALQADIKLPGIPFRVVEEAMRLGHSGICRILDVMEGCISEPKRSKANWPVRDTVLVPVHKRGRFLGPGGINLKRLLADTGVQVTPGSGPNHESGTGDTWWNVFAPNSEAMAEAKEAIQKLLSEQRAPELDFGAIYKAVILELRERGVLVTLHPDLSPVMVSNAQLDARKVLHPSALGLQVGQEIQVKYYGRDPVTGAIRISRKALTVGAASALKQLKNATSTASGSPSR